MKKFLKYELQSVAGMVGISVYILADTFFISVYAGADGLAMLNLVLPVYGVIYAIGSMIGIGSATRYGINRAKGEDTGDYFLQSFFFSILFSIPFMLTGFLAPQKFLGLLGADAKLAGAALATAVCPAVTMSICGVHYLGRKNTVGFHWKRPGFSHLISCCKMGISAFVGEISSAVITIVFNMLILGSG